GYPSHVDPPQADPDHYGYHQRRAPAGLSGSGRLRPGYNAAGRAQKACNPSGCVGREQHGSFDLRGCPGCDRGALRAEGRTAHYGGLHLYQERTTICPLCARSGHLAPVTAGATTRRELLRRRSTDPVSPIQFAGDSMGTVYIASDLEELHARFRASVVVITLVLLVSSTIAFLLAAGLQKLVSEPILELAEIANVVSADKNYGIRAPIRSHDELGILVSRFNEMLGQIQIRDQELQHHREHLEDEVATRTEELRSTNTQLETAKEAAEAANRRQKRVPGQHEPRDPYAHERCAGNDGVGAGHRAHRRAARVLADCQILRR